MAKHISKVVGYKNTGKSCHARWYGIRLDDDEITLSIINVNNKNNIWAKAEDLLFKQPAARDESISQGMRAGGVRGAGCGARGALRVPGDVRSLRAGAGGGCGGRGEGRGAALLVAALTLLLSRCRFAPPSTRAHHYVRLHAPRSRDKRHAQLTAPLHTEPSRVPVLALRPRPPSQVSV
ncbi:hypothetical protein O0L34_g18045 [Tuta absoluta]|nr:hypothetical protein O0L34_g18045 [Tuta absoluta]